MLPQRPTDPARERVRDSFERRVKIRPLQPKPDGSHKRRDGLRTAASQAIACLFVAVVVGATGCVVLHRAVLPELRRELRRQARETLSELDAEMGTLRRKLLVTTASADALSHTSSDGSAALTISSDVTVDIESVRFNGVEIGIASDPNLLSLSDNLLTVNGAVKPTAVGCYGFVSPAIFVTAVDWRAVDQLAFTGIAPAWNSGACTTGGIFTAPYDGYYFVSGSFRVDGLSGGYARLTIFINGAITWTDNGGSVLTSGNSDTYDMLQLSNVLKLSATNTIQFKIYSSVDDTYNLSPDDSHMSVYMLNRA